MTTCICGCPITGHQQRHTDRLQRRGPCFKCATCAAYTAAATGTLINPYRDETSATRTVAWAHPSRAGLNAIIEQQQTEIAQLRADNARLCAGETQIKTIAQSAAAVMRGMTTVLRAQRQTIRNLTVAIETANDHGIVITASCPPPAGECGHRAAISGVPARIELPNLACNRGDGPHLTGHHRFMSRIEIPRPGGNIRVGINIEWPQ